MKRILLVGGDERALRMAMLLEQEGYEVQTFGLRHADEKNAEICTADALLFPYPHAVRAGNVPTLTGLTVHAQDVLESAKADAIVLAGGGLEPYILAENAMGKSLQHKQYMQVETFLQMNAELSAEAAVYETMRQTDEALFAITVLVIGYGRFGRALAKRLHTLGATVWVAARSEKARLLTASDGMKAFALENLPNIAPQVRIVLNTVPARVLEAPVLRTLPKNICLLELASAPYGFEREQVQALKLHYEVLPALPARYAPETAAKALKQATVQLLLEARL